MCEIIKFKWKKGYKVKIRQQGFKCENVGRRIRTPVGTNPQDLKSCPFGHSGIPTNYYIEFSLTHLKTFAQAKQNIEFQIYLSNLILKQI